MANYKNRKHKMKRNLLIIIFVLFLTGCGSIGAYTETPANTQVNFFEYSTNTNGYVNKHTSLKIAETGLVSGSTLLYEASGSRSLIYDGQEQYNVVYPLWINESEVAEVEFAIEKYRCWQEQVNPEEYLSVQPINEYTSQWMNGITFKFGLFNGKQGKPFMSICYEFTEAGRCTFTYMIDGENIELLSDDLDKFKQHPSELHELHELAG